MADTLIRDASGDDLDAIAKVAVAVGQDEEWSGSDPAYVRHLLAHGRVVVAELRGVVTGFGATRRIGPEGGGATMLCDLFAHPRAHGLGLGQAMLAALWQPGTPRMTFSSTHPHAMPLYTRAGLDAWWPLLCLAGPTAAAPAPPGWAVEPTTAERVAALELDWTGLDRVEDHRAWAARPAGRPVVASLGGVPAAAGVVAGAGDEHGIVHLAPAPLSSGADGAARDGVLAVLASLEPPNGRARVCLPAPHPAVRPLLAAGWRVEHTDLFMATDPALLDPRRAVPSPALA